MEPQDDVTAVAAPKFDFSFNFGHVLTALGLLAAAFVGYGVMSGAVTNLDTRLLRIEEAMGPAIIGVATGDRRLIWLENQTVAFNEAVIRIEAQIGLMRELLGELRAANNNGN